MTDRVRVADVEERVRKHGRGGLAAWAPGVSPRYQDVGDAEQWGESTALARSTRDLSADSAGGEYSRRAVVSRGEAGVVQLDASAAADGAVVDIACH